MTAEQAEQRRDLYDAGLSDPEIGGRIGMHMDTVRKWRAAWGLPPNSVPGRNGRANSTNAVVTPDLKRQALTLLERGMGADEIARETGLSAKTVWCWRGVQLRERPELRRSSGNRPPVPRYPKGAPYSRMRGERRRRALLLYADGLTDQAIADELGIRRQQVWEWRSASFLPPVEPKPSRAPKRRRFSGAPISPLRDPLYARIVASIGGGIASDLRDDAASDIWLAIAEGKLAADDLARAAPRYRNRVVATYASRFGPVSIDEAIGDTDGLRLVDLIRDDRASAWLERSGATTW